MLVNIINLYFYLLIKNGVMECFCSYVIKIAPKVTKYYPPMPLISDKKTLHTKKISDWAGPCSRIFLYCALYARKRTTHLFGPAHV